MKTFLRHLALGLLVAGAAVLARVRPGAAPPPAPRAATRAESAAASAPDSAPAAAAPAAGGGVVHLNRATLDELETLPGIGPALGRRILDFRAGRGPFRDAGELRLVRGIGPKKWARLRARVAP